MIIRWVLSYAEAKKIFSSNSHSKWQEQGAISGSDRSGKAMIIFTTRERIHFVNDNDLSGAKPPEWHALSSVRSEMIISTLVQQHSVTNLNCIIINLQMTHRIFECSFSYPIKHPQTWFIQSLFKPSISIGEIRWAVGAGSLCGFSKCHALPHAISRSDVIGYILVTAWHSNRF